MALSNQMEMFEDGGLKDEGGMTDEVSGNDVPSGSTREEVRDDIPAQLSEGEFVFPADVVRFLGLEKLMQMRQKAKMGLQKMEDMGQMGNSDEATMPDDMPFDLNDLDMQEDVDNEEDVEYNKGGVVKAAVGAYVPPALPTSNPYDPTKNVYTGQTNEAVTPYMPKATNILGASDPSKLVGGVPVAEADSDMFEQRRYVNEATGQVRFVSFNKATGQSTTNVKQLLDQGFIRKDEAIKEAAKTSTPTSTNRRPQEEGDGGDGGPNTFSQTDPSGIGYNKSTLQSDDLKGLFDNVSVMEGLGVLSPMYNIGRSMAGKGNVSAAKNSAIGGIIDGFRGGTVTYNGTNARNTGLQSGTYDNNISLNDLSFAQQSQIGRVGNAVFASVIDPMIYDIDKDGNKTAKSDSAIRNNAINKAKELGLDITIPNTNIVLRTNTILRNIAKKEYEKQAKADTAFDISQRATTEEDSVYGDTVDRGKGADVGFNVGQQSASDFYSDYSGPSSGMTDADTAAAQTDDGSFAGGYEDDDMYNKGGLAGKKKTPKPKKMKRGGLASR